MVDRGTFLNVRQVTQPVSGDGHVAVVGVPYDGGITWRAGTREGPRALRAASTNWAYRKGSEPYWDGEIGASLLGGVDLVDAGDVDLAPGMSVEAVGEAIAGRLAALVSAGLFPVVLGGDHSITYPVLQGVASARRGGGETAGPAPQLVHFDAHMDYWDEIDGRRLTHASPVIRSHEAGLVDGVTQYGIRGLHTADDNLEAAAAKGVRTFWCEEVKRRPPEELVAHLAPGADTWVSFDIDCLDPGIAPGTGTPEPGGLTYYEAKALLLAVASRVKVIGLDLVEVNPLYDPGELASLHGARLVLDLLGAVWRSSSGAL